MHIAVAPLMERYPIFSSRDVEEARAFLHGKEFDLHVARRDARELNMRINGIYLPGMYVGYIQYGPPVDVRAVQRDDYWIQMPIVGGLEVVGGLGGVTCDIRQAAVASPTCRNYYLVRSGGGCAGVRLSFFKAALIRQLEALLGEPIDEPLEFAPRMDLTAGYGRTLASYMLTAMTDLQSSDSTLTNAKVMSSFEQFIMTSLLLSHPHNYRKALEGLDIPVVPRGVRRAIDFIEAHLSLPITIVDIVAATGVPGRTLFKHFRDYKGISPIRYLRDARFRSVRHALSKAEIKDTTVTEIAASWGFTHLGRFSMEYRRRFGESPSQTLKRRR